MNAETFHARFFPVFATIALFGAAAGFGLLLLIEGGAPDLTGAAVAGLVVLAGASTSARRLIAAYPVVVRPGGIRVYGLRGGPAIDSHWIEWAAIARAHRFYVPFILCLVLHTRAQQRFWIPLDLAGAPRLRQLVYAHAGRAHALARALSG